MKTPWLIIRSRSETMATFGVGIALTFVGGVVGYELERGQDDANITSVGDGIWWAITTSTTVGYGDRYPVTSGGRVLGTGLMLLGIGVLSVLTASVAAWFVQADQSEEESEIQRLNQRVDDLVRLIEAQYVTPG